MQREMSSAIKKIKKWIKENKVVDVVIFGSFVRGKIKPADVDLCILINDRDEKRSLDIVDSLSKLDEAAGLKFHVNILTLSSFFKGNTLAKTLLSEGFSIKNEERFSKVFDFDAKSLFVYTLKHFSPSQRVSFHYLLKGRYGSDGVLKTVHGSFLGTGSILVPVENEDLLKEVFEKWKVKYEIKRVLIG